MNSTLGKTLPVEDALVMLATAIGTDNGFRPVDIPNGHLWAGRVTQGQGLTDEQARAAHRLLTGTYREQLSNLGVAGLTDPPEISTPAPQRVAARTTVRIGVMGTGSDARLLTVTPISFKDAMKQLPGAQWHSPGKCRSCVSAAAGGRGRCKFSSRGQGIAGWHLPATPSAALAVHDVVGDEQVKHDQAYALLLEQARLARAAGGARTATDLPPIPGLKTNAWMHQRQAFSFAIAQPGAILDMEMGTGKSLTAVGLIVAKAEDARREGRRFRALIQCPERVVGVWPKQFSIHARQEFHVVEGRKENRNGEYRFLPVKDRVAEFDHALNECGCGKPHVVMANYAIGVHEPFPSWAKAQSWDVLVLDEVHKIKSAGGKWAKLAQELGQRSRFRVGLTGTLMPHSPMDAFSQVRAIDTGVFGTAETKFKHRYMEMGGYQNKNVIGLLPEREDEFAAKVASVTYRVGAEVLDLPAEVPDVVLTCGLPKDGSGIYRQVQGEMYAEIRQLLADGRTAEASVTADNVLVKLLRLQQITGGAVQLDGDEEGQKGPLMVFKDQPKADLLRDLLSDIHPSDPVVVFCKFRNDLDQVQKVAEALGRKYGELSGRRDDALARDATLADGVEVAGIQLQAGGTGIDFTRSHHCVYYSQSHSLGDYLQSRKRLARPGQTESVRFYHLVSEGSIDNDVYEALSRREDVAKYVGGLVRARMEQRKEA